jgi:replicative DNA helicase
MAADGIDDAYLSLQVPPHSVDAERSTLGGLMIDPQAWDKVSTLLTPDDFYEGDHRTIFRCMLLLGDQNKPLDIITLAESLESGGDLDAVGGIGYLSNLADQTPSAANVTAYAGIVAEKAVIRRLIDVGNKIAESGYRPEGRDGPTLVDEAEAMVFRIGDERPSMGGPEQLQPLLAKAVNRIDELFQNKGALTGLSTGFRDIDDITAGLQNSDLVVIAARPSMGKTAFAMNIAVSAIMSNDRPVIVFSMEMPADSLVLRMLSSLGHIDQTKIRNGQLGDDDWPRLTAAVTMLNDKNLLIDDTAALTPNEVRSRSRRVAREFGAPALIIVDYLQLMRVAGTTENRTGEISEISRSLKAIAKEFDCPVIALSQLNRSLEQRPDKRPIMSDLRESGAIEQDADVIMAIYRDEVYREDAQKGVAEIIILKQRNGPIGRKKLAFIGNLTKFEDLAEGYEDYV